MASIKEKLLEASREQLQAVWEKMRDYTFEGIRAAGELATKEQYEARLNVCDTLESGKPCRYKGLVKPLPIDAFEVPGCTECGCPFETKAQMIEFAFNVVKCPHPNGNQWAGVDEKFKTAEHAKYHHSSKGKGAPTREPE